MKLTIIAVTLALALGAPARTFSAPSDALFDAWRGDHGKEYSSLQEHTLRREVFYQNKLMVEQHNAKNLSWTMGLNQFADLTTQEFNDRLGLRPALHEPAGNKHVASGVGAATSMDWRTKNAVTPVKNQGSCGSCWAFSTVVSLEGQVAIKTGKVVSFSEQDFVDCVKDVKLNSSSQTCCDGCQGGLMDYAFKYMLDSQSGLDDTEAAYPYAGANQKCSFSSSSTGGVPIKGFTDVTDENTLLDAVTNVGPVSVGVDAGIGWQLYFGGVMDPLPIVGCSADKSKMDHGVAVVGYGTANKDYWIIKNSWGAGWGEKGYLRLVRNKNACGVANGAVYPTL